MPPSQYAKERLAEIQKLIPHLHWEMKYHEYSASGPTPTAYWFGGGLPSEKHMGEGFRSVLVKIQAPWEDPAIGPTEYNATWHIHANFPCNVQLHAVKQDSLLHAWATILGGISRVGQAMWAAAEGESE